MKKLLTFFTTLLFLGSMTVKADYYVSGINEDWSADKSGYKMSGSGPYSLTKQLATGSYRFKITNGTWVQAWGSNNKDNTRSNVTLSDNEGNIAFTLSNTSDVTFYFENGSTPKIYVKIPSYTIASGTTIYYDFTAYDGGVNVCINGSDIWHENTSAIFSETLNSSWEVTTSTNIFKSAPPSNSWSYKTCSTLPTEGQNMVVGDADGINCHWSTYVAPSYSVDFDGLAAQVLKGTAVNFAATSSGITNPVYSFYVKSAGGSYGSAVTSYTFDTNGEFVVKVEAIGDGMSEPVTKEQNVSVYETYTFTAGTRLYVDFSAMTEGAKGVNFPYQNTTEGLNWDGNGAGTSKIVLISQNVTWSTLDDFIKTEKAGWAGLKFTAPGEGQNKVIVAADGASYTWGTYPTALLKFFAPKNVDHPWSNVYAYTWDDAGDLSAAWPGDAVTTKEGEWYTYTIPVGANLVFHDNNGMQTNNIENIAADACYVSTVIDDTQSPQKVAVTEQCTVDYYISGTKELTGLTEDWVVADASLKLDANNQIVFHNLEAGTYEFKITNGTWAWSIGGNDHLMTGECASIATTEGLGNVGFTIASKQDVTITYYPETEKICLGAVTVKTTATLTVNDFGIEAGESKQISYWTNNTEATGVNYEILSGAANIHLNAGVILGIKAGTATVRATIAETANYTAASDEFTVTVTTPTAPAIAPIAPIGGKFTINAHGDTAIFARGNLQYQQSSNTWRCAPNQFEWKGTDNLQMGNSEYEGWVDLFCWSIGDENNYGATSAYLTTLYYNKDFVDWGGLFTDTYEWSTLSINEWYYLLYSRANANNLWGMAMIDDNLGLIILPDEWIAPSGVTFVAGTIPTTDMWHNSDCLDPTHADEDHWRINSNNLPTNKFTQSEWTILEAAGAVFLPYGGRRSGGYGNHTNRQDQTVDYEYAYSYYENYYGSYWTSTVAKPAEGKSYWLPMICGGCDANHENWGRGSHGWWENGRYGHSVRLVTRIPKQEEPEWQTVRSGLTAGNYYTVCYNKNMSDVRGATLWSFAGKESDLAYLVQEDGPYAAGTPYIVYAESDKLEAIVEEVALPVAGDKNGLYGTFSLMDQTAIDAVGKDVYLLIGNQLRQANGRSGNSLPAYRAYVVFSEITGGEPKGMAPGRVRRISMQPNAATGMDEISDPSSNIRKVLKDGQLLILRGENLYDATGRMVK